MFDPDYPYMNDLFRRLSGDEEAFDALVSFLTSNNYRLISCRDNQIALDYVINYSDKELPLKASWAERTRGGFSAQYDYKVKEPPYFSLRVPMLKELLARFGEMDDELKSFVVQANRNCDGCRYCVQTDKTGKRPLICVRVRHDEKSYALCPLFPGFYYCWESLSNDLVKYIVAYLTFINKVFTT